MGVLIPGLTVALAWVFSLFNLSPVGAATGDVFGDTAMRWLLFLPGGIMFLVSAFMHTVLAKRTAAQIGWVSNGFQREIGFVSAGLGVAGIMAASAVPAAWWPIATAQGIFLILCTVQHVYEMAKSKNFKPGNTLILIYDIGLPVSYLALAISLSNS